MLTTTVLLKLRLERVDRVELILLDTSIGHVTLFELGQERKKKSENEEKQKHKFFSHLIKVVARLFH